MASPVDLGTAVLCILDSNSSLILNSSPEVKFDSETVEFKEAESSLQLLQSRDTWVTPAPEMNLYIDISADPCLDQTLEFFSQAGELLRSSRVLLPYCCLVLLLTHNRPGQISGLQYYSKAATMFTTKLTPASASHLGCAKRRFSLRILSAHDFQPA